MLSRLMIGIKYLDFVVPVLNGGFRLLSRAKQQIVHTCINVTLNHFNIHRPIITFVKIN